MLEIIRSPWPWYVAGPLIGLTVPLLLLIGNKTFGISSSLRQICAACVPSGARYFNYDWKSDVWKLYFVAGLFIGGAIAAYLLTNDAQIMVAPAIVDNLAQYGISDYTHAYPSELFNLSSILSLRGFLLIIIGGFLVGFGTRYGNGCTSGHAIMGISNFHWPSLVATIAFMAGGFFAANILMPLILSL